MSSIGPDSHRQDADEELRTDRGRDTHRATVIAAEVRRLERHLLAIGPMPREKLAESCNSGRWREGTFEEAIQEGVRRGTLRQLPLGWVEANTGTQGTQPR
jgi:hypothetical protein